MDLQLHDPAFLAVASGGTPALDLFFSATKALDSRITFTRGSVGTFINSSGLVESAASGVARFTHDPVTLASLGLLVEESRANLVPRSEEFSDASWSKYLATVSANAGTAPDGATTADLAYPSSSGALAGQLFRAISGVTSGNVVTTSLFAKASGKTIAYLARITNSFSPGAYYDLNTGTVSNVAAGCTASIEQFPNGWWRLVLTSTATTGTNYAVFGSCDAAGSTTNTASGTNGILAWGYQSEIGAFATSYIPTTSATVTRAADVAEMTGTNFSSWYRQDEGTVFAEVAGGSSTTFPRAFSFSNGTISEQIAIGYDVTRVRTANADVASFFSSTDVNGKYAIALRANDFACARSGVLQTDSAGAMPTIDRIALGASPTGTGLLNGTIARIRYYRRRLPNANLHTLTT